MVDRQKSLVQFFFCICFFSIYPYFQPTSLPKIITKNVFMISGSETSRNGFQKIQNLSQGNIQQKDNFPKFNIFNPFKLTQLTFTCSKSTIETLEKRLKNGVSFVDFVQINAGWACFINYLLIVLLKVFINKRNTRKRYEICSKLKIKTQNVIVNFDHISNLFQVFLLLTLKK